METQIWEGTLKATKKLQAPKIDVNGDANIDGNAVVDVDLTVSGELKGAVIATGAALDMVALANGGTQYGVYHGIMIMSSTVGIMMPKAGSIIGLSAMLNMSAVAVGTGSIQIQCLKNNSNVFSFNIGVTGVGVFEGASTQARNTDTFVAGDNIQFAVRNATGGIVSGTCGFFALLQFDT